MLKQMVSFFPGTWMMKWGSPSTENISKNGLTPCTTRLPWPPGLPRTPGPVGKSKTPITLNLDKVGGAKQLTIIVGGLTGLVTGYGTKGDQIERSKLSWGDLEPPFRIWLIPLPI